MVVGRWLAPADIELTDYGKIAQEQLLLLEERYPHIKIDRYVIMPDHIHLLLRIKQTAGASPRPTIEDMMCVYKSLTTRKCKAWKPITALFQSSFYEHIIRNREDYEETLRYIVENPIRWIRNPHT